MPFDPRSFEFPDALATSQDAYAVEFPDWGVRTVAAAAKAINPNFQWPPPGSPAAESSLAVMAIGPRSTVDRCWVTWNRQKIVTAIPSDTPVAVDSRPRQLSAGSPIVFATGGRPGYLPSVADPPILNNDPQTAMHNGWIYAFPKERGDAAIVNSSLTPPGFQGTADTTILPSTYVDETGAITPLASSGFIGTLTILPFLELLLYPQAPRFAPPAQRFPYFFDATRDVIVGSGFNVVAQVPIFGRRHTRVSLRTSTFGGFAGTTNYRVGVLRNINEGAAALSRPIFEAPVGSAAGVAANQAVDFDLGHLCADYLNVYAQTVGGGVPGRVQVTVAAYD